MNGAYAPPLTAPPAFADRQSRGRQQGVLPPRTIIQRGGISMTEDEAYKVHIQYTFNAPTRTGITTAATFMRISLSIRCGLNFKKRAFAVQ